MTSDLEQKAVPLCYPDNFDWVTELGTLVKKTESRGKLVVCEDALDILRSIDGLISPIAVTGLARCGKSYIASELIEPRPDECVFKMSNKMRPLTTGIWINTVPFKKRLENGTEVTVVVMDTEGLCAYDAHTPYDVQIFTLISILSSVMIYNSKGTLTAEDIKMLSLVDTLDQVIKGNNYSDSRNAQTKDFIQFFPNFMWLLRDATLNFSFTEDEEDDEDDEVDIKDYILKEVLKLEEEDDKTPDHTIQKNRQREALLSYFPEFDAMTLSMPSHKPKVLAQMGLPGTRKRLSSSFNDGVDEFIERCGKLMKPKKAWPYVGNIHGKQFAELVKQYVANFDFEGQTLDVHAAGAKVLDELLFREQEEAYKDYCKNMDSFAASELPCENRKIATKHKECVVEALDKFTERTECFNAADLIDRQRKHLQDRCGRVDEDKISGGYLRAIIEKNKQKSKEYCTNLARQLVEEHLRPFTSESGPRKSGISADLNESIEHVKKLYNHQGRGPRKDYVYKTEVTEKIAEIAETVKRRKSRTEGRNVPEADGAKSEAVNVESGEIEERERFRKQILEMKQNVEQHIRRLMREDVERQKQQSDDDNKERSEAIAKKIQQLYKTHHELAKQLQMINTELSREHETLIDELTKKYQRRMTMSEKSQ
ncbi:guanylate-binding protein 1-like [Ptychodera flava]|uniref:guanylate-binding protein 1-like n=1 Tax=Ptychodera flava TaxID=63121 RepID=UPI00396A6EE9